jgi:DNA-binding response OmpR family regulator
VRARRSLARARSQTYPAHVEAVLRHAGAVASARSRNRQPATHTRPRDTKRPIAPQCRHASHVTLRNLRERTTEDLIRGVDARNGSDFGAGTVKVLLVDDDPDELDLAAYVLRRDGFAVAEASDRPQAVKRFLLESPDIVVVSLAMPDSAGVEVLREIRAGHQTRVLVTVGRDNKQDLFRCFEFGADDFITRPFAPRDLVLRVHAILRRTTDSTREKSEAPFKLGDLRLDPETHEVSRGSFEVRLTPTEFRIFHALAKSAEHVVPAKRLMSYVTGTQGGVANSLRSHICHLRKKLALDGGAGGSIASVPAVGYVFRAPTRSEQDAPSALVLKEAAVGS